jgi:two-component system KDP operon response regulator KdpE
MLPDDLDGYEVCRRLREFSEVPIIMLTARAQDADIERGFDAGVDDYVTKPFNAKELVARVRAVLRRSHRPEETVTTAVKCGDLEINFARRTVTVRGAVVELTRTEFALLRELALNANRVMTHEDLLTKVWGPEYRDVTDYLRAYIRFLRRKLEADPANPRYVLTSPGVGYLMECPPRD